jgi:hypothetical protein
MEGIVMEEMKSNNLKGSYTEGKQRRRQKMRQRQRIKEEQRER